MPFHTILPLLTQATSASKLLRRRIAGGNTEFTEYFLDFYLFFTMPALPILLNLARPPLICSSIEVMSLLIPAFPVPVEYYRKSAKIRRKFWMG